jgi:hypothetical protein
MALSHFKSRQRIWGMTLDARGLPKGSEPEACSALSFDALTVWT